MNDHRLFTGSLVICGIVMILFSFVVDCVSADSFGNTELPDDGVVDVEFDKLFSDKMSLHSDELIVSPTYKYQDGLNKYKIDFNVRSVDAKADSDFVFHVDGNCSDLKTVDEWNVTFLLDGVGCFFDWSDLKSTSLKYEINVSDGFSFVVTVPLLEKGKQYVFDPTFGYTTTGSSLNLQDGTTECMFGTWFTVPVDCVAKNISVYFHDTWQLTKNVTCAIYEYVSTVNPCDGLIGQTEVKSITSANCNSIVVFDFVSEPELVGGSAVTLVVGVCNNSGDGICSIKAVNVGGDVGSYCFNQYSPYPDPLTGDGSHGWKPYIFCSYEIESEISNEIPANETVVYDLNSYCSVDVNNALGYAFDVFWYENSSGAWVLRYKDENNGNGTFTHIFSEFDEWNETYYWMVAVNDSKTNVSVIYHFTTSQSTVTESNFWVYFVIWLVCLGLMFYFRDTIIQLGFTIVFSYATLMLYQWYPTWFGNQLFLILGIMLSVLSLVAVIKKLLNM